MVVDVSVADDVAVLAEVWLVADDWAEVPVDAAGEVLVDVVEAAVVVLELEAAVVLLVAAFSSLAAEHPDNPATASAARPTHPTVTLKLRFMATKRTGEGRHPPANE